MVWLRPVYGRLAHRHRLHLLLRRIDSPFTFLYIMPILVSSIVLAPQGWARHGFVGVHSVRRPCGPDLQRCHTQPRGLHVTAPPWRPATSTTTCSCVWLAFYASALLATYVSEKLRRTGMRLEEQRADLASLQKSSMRTSSTRCVAASLSPTSTSASSRSIGRARPSWVAGAGAQRLARERDFGRAGRISTMVAEAGRTLPLRADLPAGPSGRAAPGHRGQ